jgi:hypothetical protein
MDSSMALQLVRMTNMATWLLYRLKLWRAALQIT